MMKRIKKWFVFFLAFSMMLAMSMTAVAENTGGTVNNGSITIQNPTVGESYTIYKVFDLVYLTEGEDEKTVSAVTYTYTKSSEDKLYEALVNGVTENDITLESPFTLTATKDENVYGVTLKEKIGETPVTTATVVQFLTKLVDKNILTTTIESKEAEYTKDDEGNATTTVGVVKWESLYYGYYYIKSSLGAVISLTSTTPDATVVDKNEIPFDKTVDDHSVELGQTVTFAITGQVPDYTGFTQYVYQITDTMSKGLTLNQDVSVKIGEGDSATSLNLKNISTGSSDATESSHEIKYESRNVFICGQEEDENHSHIEDCKEERDSFVLSIDVMALGEVSMGKTITVTYTATVNEDAVAVISKNKAELKYSNDPTNTESYKTITDEEKLYSAKIVIDKYEGGKTKTENNETVPDTDTKLEGAEFVLYRYALENTNGTYSFTFKNDNGDVQEVSKNTQGATKVYYTCTGTTTSPVVGWNNVLASATVKTTDEEGAANFPGLEDGTYYLLETKAPAGYNLLKEAVEIQINGTSATVENVSSLTETKKVANSKGSELPSTGGVGTTIFYVLGAILVIGAGILLVVRRCMGAEK